MTSRPAAAQHPRDLAWLRRGDLSVTEVCFRVGYSSLGSFSTRFTDLAGVPPSTYRRETRSLIRFDSSLRLAIKHGFRIIRWHPLNREAAALTWATE